MVNQKKQKVDIREIFFQQNSQSEESKDLEGLKKLEIAKRIFKKQIEEMELNEDLCIQEQRK